MNAIIDLKKQSPLGVFQEHCRQGLLAYQISSSGRAVFYPRICEPQSGEMLTWKVSKGLGVVYAVTVLYPKGEDPYNVVLVDMDEGFRLMSRVSGIDAEKVVIGMRVKVHMDLSDPLRPLPLFEPLLENPVGEP
jgi:uncharacterized OB-fold protein